MRWPGQLQEILIAAPEQVFDQTIEKALVQAQLKRLVGNARWYRDPGLKDLDEDYLLMMLLIFPSWLIASSF